jgi:hypothetical protein
MGRRQTVRQVGKELHIALAPRKRRPPQLIKLQEIEVQGIVARLNWFGHHSFLLARKPRARDRQTQASFVTIEFTLPVTRIQRVVERDSATFFVKKPGLLRKSRVSRCQSATPSGIRESCQVDYP